VTTGTLQRVLNAAVRLVTDTRKYDRGLSTMIHDQLAQRLNVPERVYKLAVMVRRCLENKAPRYLVNCCTLVADAASRHRRSAVLGKILCKSILSTSTSNQPKKYLKYKYKYII